MATLAFSAQHHLFSSGTGSSMTAPAGEISSGFHSHPTFSLLDRNLFVFTQYLFCVFILWPPESPGLHVLESTSLIIIYF